MDTNFPLLQEISEHYADSMWMQAHADDVLESINEALQDTVYQSQAVDTLLRAFPYIIPLGNIKRWSEVLRDAFDIYLGEDDLNSFGGIFLTNTQTEEIDKAISVALRRVRKRISPPLMLEAYINLFQLQVYHLTDGIDDTIILSAMDLARIVNEQASYARLNRALAYAYVRRGFYDRSMEHAKFAYAYYLKHERKIEMAISAYGIALCHRYKGNLDRASHWLDLAAENFSQTQYSRQYAVIAAEKGNLYITYEDFTEAHQWLTIANNEAQLLDPHRRATIQHSYGIVQIHLGLFEEAEDSLNLSLRYWQDINDLHQIAHLLYAFAFWAYKQEDYAGALDYLDQSETIYSSIQNNPFNGQVTALIDNLRQEIANVTG